MRTLLKHSRPIGRPEDDAVVASKRAFVLGGLAVVSVLCGGCRKDEGDDFNGDEWRHQVAEDKARMDRLTQEAAKTWAENAIRQAKADAEMAALKDRAIKERSHSRK